MRRRAINPNSRDQALQRIADGDFDVCVIGAGAVGAGCALDAQLRGLQAVLLDAGDFGGATSSASTKLVHGGVRYLQQAVANFDPGQFHVVRRALQERKLLLDNAPHLAHPLRFLVPCYSRFQGLYYGVGMKLYDRISGRANLFPSRWLSRQQALENVPQLRRQQLVGAVAYADGQFDDARYTLALVKSFAEAGGHMVNHATVCGLERDPGGKLCAARVEDRFSHRAFTVRARTFVNATGPFSDDLVALANPEAPKRLVRSKGVHLLLPIDPGTSPDALLIPKTEDGRVIFAIPWQGLLLVGTTEDEIGPDQELMVTKQEAEYLLRHLNRYLERQRTLEEIQSAMAGVRPLVRVRGVKQTRKLIRDHEVQVDERSGLVSILGGKWTTYRLMAEETIDVVQRSQGRAVTPSSTRHHPLVGARGFTPDYGRLLESKYGVPSATAQHLSQKYGTEAEAVLELARESAGLMAPVVEGAAPIQAEVAYGIRNEMALTIEDVLARRIGLQYSSWKLAIRAAPVVSSYLAEALGWSPVEAKEATRQYVAKIHRWLEAIGLPVEKGSSR